MSQLAMNGFEIRFKDKEVTIGMRGQVLINGFLSDKLYLLDAPNDEIKSCSHYFVCVNVCMDGLAMLWHMRLWHINKNRISRMVRVGLLPDLGKVEYPTCEPYLSGKMVKKPFPKGTRSSKILTIIHYDICGPLNVQNRMGED